jgi:hypothetical protein
VSLPKQDELDAAVGRLSVITDAVDGVHRVADRAGILRLAPADPEAAAHRDAGLEQDYTGKLAELEAELGRALKWVRADLKQLAG